MATGDTKAAVKQAKRMYRDTPTVASAALVREAYEARVAALRERGLTVEANQLAEEVERRFPREQSTAASTVTPTRAEVRRVEELAARLIDPALTPAQREGVEADIRRGVTDPAALATCEFLPSDHPLRVSAAAVMRALEAVTRGPVSPDDLALPEVSRRSPLAPWKVLIRAIGCFYRGEDDACRRLLEAVEPASAPARLMGPLRAMLAGGRGDADLSSAGARLVASVSHRALREALGSLEKALTGGKSRRKLPGAIRRAVEACGRDGPEHLGRLKQHISIRCLLRDCPADKVVRALGGPALHDAYFWRLYARAYESRDEVIACALWEEFRRNAVSEGWFAPTGPEAAAIYLHMLDLLLRIPADELPHIRHSFRTSFPGFAEFYASQPAWVRRAAPASNRPAETYFLDHDELFRRACECMPDPAVFERWLAYAERTHRSYKPADEVAHRWHEALPSDPRPLLHLAASAERRGAFTKATKFLAQAQQLDAVNPEVRRMQMRLMVATTLRHLKQGKAHLAEKDLGALAGLPEALAGDRPAFLAALRWVGAVVAGDDARADTYRQEAARALGDSLAGDVLLTHVATACQQTPRLIRNGRKLPPGPKLAAAVARSCYLGQDMAGGFEIPSAWLARLRQGIDAGGEDLGAERLLALAASAVREGQDELAYAASGAALRAGSDQPARGLLLRAQSLPCFAYDRREECFAVAAELARRQRDTELVSETIDAWRGPRQGWFVGSFDPEDIEVDDEAIAFVLSREKQARTFPTFESTWNAPAPEAATAAPRHRRRGKAASPLPSLFDDLLDEEETDFEDDGFFFPDNDDEDEYDDPACFPPDLFGEWDATGATPHDGLPTPPHEVMRVLMELLAKTGGRMPGQRELEKIVRQDPELMAKMLNLPLPPGMDDLPWPDAAPPFDAGGQGRRRSKRKKSSKRQSKRRKR